MPFDSILATLYMFLADGSSVGVIIAILSNFIRNTVEQLKRQIATLALLRRAPSLHVINHRQRVQARIGRAQHTHKIPMIVHALREERHQTVERGPSERVHGVAL